MKSCRACRLDKCLLEGMDPTMVEAEQSAELSQFIHSLYKRRAFLQQQLKEKEEKICHMDTKTVIENDKNGRTVDVRNEEIMSVIQQLLTMPHFEMLEPIDQVISWFDKIEYFLAVFGLSDDGLRTLQHLSEHYANLLMNHLCTNYGNMAGAHRHAELVHVAKSMFSNAERLPEYYWRKFSNCFLNKI
ncbi:hypothetical protein niasHT_005974 [Heterodera trifolii]|uniref:Nuclear receptor domain-containing protein n=1 Tax=Heterodera trifolii TaxID=157864 RepID=A0ABD2LWV5_9BILA